MHTNGVVLGHTGDAHAIMRKSVQCIFFVWAPDPPFIKQVKTHHRQLTSTVTFPTLHTATMEICLWYLITDYFYSTVNRQCLQFDKKFMIKQQNKMWNTEFNDIFNDSELQSYWHWSYLITLIDYGVF